MACLKKLGVTAAIGFSAVGSLREEVKPRDFVVAGGVVDWTKGVGLSSLSSPISARTAILYTPIIKVPTIPNL